MKQAVTFIIFLISSIFNDVVAQVWQVDGNLKYRLVNTTNPDDSIYRELSGKNTTDHIASTRINLAFNLQQWSAEVNYQLAGFLGDTLETSHKYSSDLIIQSPNQNDDVRLVDLTDSIKDKSEGAIVHRLDRLNISFQNANNVVKLGRQAVSWGNGLVYTPMDFFNPFGPATIDTEYKPGEDMLYMQHLFNNGNDLQAVWVARRDENNHSSHAVNSIALKYHGFLGSSELDFLLSEHYQDTIIGIGGTFSVGGSVVRGDWVMTHTGEDRYNNVVANISYSWVSWNKNMTGSLEYFHNDFGIRDSRFSATNLIANAELLGRLSRKELFTLGRDYLVGSAVVEMTPLWLLTPSIFRNLSDSSTLTQLISQHSLSQNSQLTIALSVPVGSRGTEFGGFSIESENSTLSEQFTTIDWSIYAQLGWYF